MRFLLLIFGLAWLVAGWWRVASPRLEFAKSGRVSVAWLRPARQGVGAHRARLTLPRWVSRRLWIERACDPGRIGRWLRGL